MKTNNKNIEDLFKNQFDDFAIEPSLGLWKNISYKLFISNFMKFGFGHINIYYSVVSLALLISCGMFISEIYSFDSDELISKKTELIDEVSEKDAIIVNSDNPKNLLSGRNDAESIDEIELIKSKDESVEIKDNSVEEQTAIISIKTEKVSDNSDEKINTNNSQVIESGKPNEYIEKINSDEENISQLSEVNNPISNIPEIVQTKEKTNFRSINKTMENDDKINIDLTNEIFYDTIFIYDTLTFYDTIITNIPVEKNKSNFSIEAYFDNFITNSVYQETAEEFSEIAKRIDDVSTSASGFAIGANLNYHFKNNLIFQTGASFSQINEAFNYEYLNVTFDTNSYYNYWIGEQLISIDTLAWEFIYDTTVGYFVYAPVLQETITTQIDSALVTEIDSSLSRNIYENKNTYSYFEIPIVFGYEIIKSRFTFTPKAGIITGIFINSKGKTISLIDSESLIDINKNSLPFIKANFTLFLGMGVNFELNEKMSLLAEPFYKTNLNSILNKNHYMSQRFNNVGIRFGLRYRF